MSVIPVRKIERNGNEPDDRNHACAAPANHIRDGDDVCCSGMGGGT
jgi:hypothetical protein